MSDYYLDASALVKRYVNETGSAWVRRLTDPRHGDTVLLAEITLAEVAAALAAKQRTPGGLTSANAIGVSLFCKIATHVFCSSR